MLAKAKCRIGDIRIWADFPRCRWKRREAHMVEAERRFDPSQLIKEVAAIQEQGRMTAHARCGARTSAMVADIEQLDLDIQVASTRLALLERDYRAELDALHAEKARLLAENMLVRVLNPLRVAYPACI